MSLARKLWSSTTSVAASDVINRGVFVLFNVVVARQISSSAFGLYALALSVGVYLWSAVEGGVTAHSLTRIAQEDRSHWPEIVGETVATRASVSLIALLVVAAALGVSTMPGSEVRIYVAGALLPVANAVFLAWLARGAQDSFGYFGAYLCVSSALALALLFFLWFPDEAQTAFSAVSLRNLAWLGGSSAAFFWLIRRYRLPVRLALFRPNFRLLRRTYPLGISGIISNLIPLWPQALLRFHDLRLDLSYYAVAWEIQRTLLGGMVVLSLVFLPMVASAFVAGRREFSRMLRLAIAVSAGAGLVLGLTYWIAGGWIVGTLFGPEYSPASQVILLFGLTLVVVFLRKTLDTALITLRRYRAMAIAGIAVLVLLLVLSVVYFDYGLLAAARLYFAAELALLILSSLVAHHALKRLDTDHQWSA